MPHLFLSHLLGVWLLLSQLPREVQGEDMIKLCGRELVRLWIKICGSPQVGRMDPSLKGLAGASVPLAEIMPSSITKDVKTLIPASPQELNTALSERQTPLKELQQAALKNSNLNSEEFKEMILNRQSETEEKSLWELNNIASAKHFSPKRNRAGIGYKCCNFGCTRKELAQYC
ncbi:prorelaxin-like [Rousettus aegyptiacus]|uniref:Relaxin 2 n=1 Tax=Rousettus aegyptiacus TaxID=9407 RepID=A0A7J8IR58_ROUAE|nr:prorelaxin-like [Rousettus aegyptiacus]KAF6487054.1 relaxin 2 [Rousettus aegyptiacus]